MKPITRRSFVRTGIAGSIIAAPAVGRVLGANERVHIALIGCGGRGTGVVGGFASRPDVACVQVCDIHEQRRNRTASYISDRQDGQRPKVAARMEEVFENDDVDAVMIGTPDHWHTPAAIMACQAGKDVYVEKPFSHNIWEGRKLVEAARKYDRIVQVGTQNRSAPYNLAARDYIRSGKLGDIRLVKVFNLKGGGPFHLGPTAPKPDAFDWTAWLGAAPPRPYHPRIFAGGWHQFWDYSGGDLADCGIHQLDLAMMILGDPEPPSTVSAAGGRMQHADDDAEVPDVEILHYEYPGYVLTFEHSHFANAMSKIDGAIRNGDRFPHWPQCATRIEFYGSKEIMMLGRHGGGWQVFTGGGKISAEMFGRFPDAEHQQNFIECVKTRKLPNADVGLAQRSTTVMHMGNIAHRVGNRKLQFDAKSERFVGDDEANRLVRRQNVNLYSVKEAV